MVINPNKAVDYIIAQAEEFARAKSQRLHIEEFRKSKKALLMKESNAKTVSERECDAYSHPDYLQLLDGYKEAVEAEEALRWKLKAAELRVEIWRSQEASNRNTDRITR